MTVMAPKHKWELADMVRFALQFEGPIAVRYPRGTAYDGFEEYREPIAYGKSEMIFEEGEIALLSVGHMFEETVKVYENLKNEGYSCSLVNARFVKPVDEEMLERLAKNHKLIVVIEENVQTGGFGEHVLEYVSRKHLDVRVVPMALPDYYVEHGNVQVLREETMTDSQSLTQRVKCAYKEL